MKPRLTSKDALIALQQGDKDKAHRILHAVANLPPPGKKLPAGAACGACGQNEDVSKLLT